MLQNTSLELCYQPRWDAWGHKLLWMTAYFTLGVWSSIALVSAPRKRFDKRSPLLARELSVSIC